MDKKFYPKLLLSVCLILGFSWSKTNAQMPQCIGDSGFVYSHVGSNIYNWDPFVPLSATNPVLNTILMPGGTPNGLAVGDNMNNPNGPTPTFYTVVSNMYYYYDGTAWVNTGHTVGNASAVNIGIGGGVLYNLVGGSGEVYRYDGTGNGTLLTTVAGFNGGGPYDIVADCEANFYLLKCTTPAWLRKYSPTGVMLQEWEVIGAPNTGAGGGFGIVGNTLLLRNSALYSGPIGATTVTVTAVPGTFPSPSDFANCPIGGAPPAKYDTMFVCDTIPGGLYTPSGTAPFGHTIVSGNATVTPTGTTGVAIRPSQLSVIIISSHTTSPCSDGGLLYDTVLVVPPPNVKAGLDDSISGCALYIDTLHGEVTNQTSWVNYYLNWTPTAAIVSGNTTTTPIINPTTNQQYVFTVTTDANQGGCSISDSVNITVVDESVVVDFDFDIYYGCDKDSVVFHNLSQNTTNYVWQFGGASTPDTATNPKHVYVTQGSYPVWLKGGNGICVDSVSKIVNTMHTIDAGFNVSADTVCQGATVVFTNYSDATFLPMNIKWHFGNGDSSSVFSPSYTFNTPGVYNVRLRVSDTIGCADSANRLIFVDSNSALQFYISDRTVCIGEQVSFNANFINNGLSKLTWDFGDQSLAFNESALVHSYLEPGVYYVTVSADYRACKDTTFTDSVMVFDLPKVMLGPDTTMCENGQPIVLTNRINGLPGQTYLWNTGDTTQSYTVRHPGSYTLTVFNAENCAASDEVVVSRDCYIDVPNSFTPNGDGVNDYFFPRSLLSKGVVGFKMQVFNRWGQLIFETTNPQGRGWDGSFNGAVQPGGVYVYSIQAVLVNGKAETYNGNVTLLR